MAEKKEEKKEIIEKKKAVEEEKVILIDSLFVNHLYVYLTRVCLHFC